MLHTFVHQPFSPTVYFLEARALQKEPSFIIKSLQIITAGEVWRKGNPPILTVGMRTGSATVENGYGGEWLRRFLKKPKVELPWDPAVPLLGIYLEKMKTLI